MRFCLDKHKNDPKCLMASGTLGYTPMRNPRQLALPVICSYSWPAIAVCNPAPLFAVSFAFNPGAKHFHSHLFLAEKCAVCSPDRFCFLSATCNHCPALQSTMAGRTVFQVD